MVAPQTRGSTAAQQYDAVFLQPLVTGCGNALTQSEPETDGF